MNTLIIPCAGKSTRFPNMRPKFLLTHPDGKLMIQKAIESMDLSLFDRVVIVLVQPHCQSYNADKILHQALGGNKKIELCILDDFTGSASETIYKSIIKSKITGSITIKDSDNYVEYPNSGTPENSVVGLRVTHDMNIDNIQSKSFIRVNENNILTDIIEKKIVSDIICLGVYSFKKATYFLVAYEALSSDNTNGELYISHIVSYLLKNQKESFKLRECTCYKDWGTLSEWKKEMHRNATYFIDFDGVLIKNSGIYGDLNWNNNKEMLTENCRAIKQAQEHGAQIVITTSRPEQYRKQVLSLLESVDIKPFAVIMGLNHAPRIIINDFAPSNPFPSATAISLPRDSSLTPYLS